MDVTKRFSNRVEDYIRFRPSYPDALVDHLLAQVGAAPPTVADAGAGTGIFAALLLARGCRVYGIEPNREMREAAERLLGDFPGFTSIAAGAEATGLADASVDLVTAAQAFHWFDAAKARAEFARILKPRGLVALIWNDRKVDASPFLVAYDALLHTLGTDYDKVNHRNIDNARLAAFYGGGHFRETVFPNAQHFDWDGLYGRAMSSSYVPAEDHPGHAAFAAGLRDLFDRHAVNGKVAFEYDARLYLGELA